MKLSGLHSQYRKKENLKEIQRDYSKKSVFLNQERERAQVTRLAWPFFCNIIFRKKWNRNVRKVIF